MNLGVCVSLDLNKAHQCLLHNSHELCTKIPWRLVVNWFLDGQAQKYCGDENNSDQMEKKEKKKDLIWKNRPSLQSSVIQITKQTSHILFLCELWL